MHVTKRKKKCQRKLILAQEEMRKTLAEGFKEDYDERSVDPIPQGATKKLVECQGLVSKRTFIFPLMT